MKLNDIYYGEVISEHNDIWPIYKHLPSDIDAGLLDNDTLEKEKKLTIKKHLDPYFDGRRVCTYLSVWFKNKPVMFCRHAGREGDDAVETFVSNKEQHIKLISYLRSLYREEYKEKLYDPDEELPQLDEFYSLINITPKDFGALKQKRQWFQRYLINWDNKYEWPYSEPGQALLSLEKKKSIRWERIKQEFLNISQEDKNLKNAIQDLLTASEGTDELIEEISKKLKELND